MDNGQLEQHSMYIIIWQYTVSKINQLSFEKEYGENGTWSEFFKTSDDYRGSELTIHVENENTYTLIDHWTSREAYSKFLQNRRVEYDNLSGQFASLYETEEKLGTFIKIAE